MHAPRVTCTQKRRVYYMLATGFKKICAAACAHNSSYNNKLKPPEMLIKSRGGHLHNQADNLFVYMKVCTHAESAKVLFVHSAHPACTQCTHCSCTKSLAHKLLLPFQATKVHMHHKGNLNKQTSRQLNEEKLSLTCMQNKMKRRPAK
jgi:hypothetical protein